MCSLTFTITLKLNQIKHEEHIFTNQSSGSIIQRCLKMNILGFLSILGKLLYFQLDEICRNVTSFLKVIELLMIHAVGWELT